MEGEEDRIDSVEEDDKMARKEDCERRKVVDERVDGEVKGRN